MTEMTVAVMGGGNASHAIAADLTLKGLNVNLFEMPRFAEQVKQVLEKQEIEVEGVSGEGTASLGLATTDVREAVSGAKIIFIPLPGFAVGPYAELLAPYLKAGQSVVIVPGTLGSLEFRWGIWQHGCRARVVVGEMGGMPFAARVVAPGRVRIFHIRETLTLATIPGQDVPALHAKLESVYPCEPCSTVLEPGFGHLTPLLHPLGCLLNAGRIERSHGDFYMYEEGMTPSVVQVIEALDRERLAIGQELGIDLPTGVQMMVESGYGPVGTLWETINGSASLTALKGPGSLGSRYVTEDIPYGLVAWASVGNLVGVDTPIMDAAVEIGSAIMGKNCWLEGRNLDKMGLEGLNLEQVERYLTTGEHPGMEV